MVLIMKNKEMIVINKKSNQPMAADGQKPPAFALRPTPTGATPGSSAPLV